MTNAPQSDLFTTLEALLSEVEAVPAELSDRDLLQVARGLATDDQLDARILGPINVASLTVDRWLIAGPNPAHLYPPPWSRECHRMWSGVNEMRAEIAATCSAALRWDLRRVRRARAAFKPAELGDGFLGSKRNPVMSQESSYLFLLSDYLREREWWIRRELLERGESGKP